MSSAALSLRPGDLVELIDGDARVIWSGRSKINGKPRVGLVFVDDADAGTEFYDVEQLDVAAVHREQRGFAASVRAGFRRLAVGLAKIAVIVVLLGLGLFAVTSAAAADTDIESDNFRVALGVSFDDDAAKQAFESHLRRQLRSLNDVTVVSPDESWFYDLHVVLVRRADLTAAVLVRSRAPRSALRDCASEADHTDGCRRRQKVFASPVWSGVLSGPQNDVAGLADRVAVEVDTVLEAKRTSARRLRELRRRLTGGPRS